MLEVFNRIDSAQPYIITAIKQVVMTRECRGGWQASLSQGWQWRVSSPTREGAIAGALLAPTGTGLEDVMMGARE